MNVPSPHDPCKLPDWRWERARWLRERGKYARKGKEDPYVVVAKAFQADQARCRDEVDRLALERKHPGIFAAEALHRRPDLPVRFALEAYLLSRARPEHIAEYCNTTVDTVVWYEKLFFNVLPYLKNDTYIVTVVMGAEVHHGLMERDYALLWKLVGYAFGPVALRDWVQPVRHHYVRHPDEIDGATDGWINRQFRRKTAVAIQTMPVYNNQAIIFEAWNKGREIAQRDGTTSGETLILTNVHAALCALPFVAGKQGVMDAARPVHYDEQGAELRAHEQMMLSMGQEPEQLRAVTEWKYPEAPARAAPG